MADRHPLPLREADELLKYHSLGNWPARKVSYTSDAFISVKESKNEKQEESKKNITLYSDIQRIEVCTALNGYKYLSITTGWTTYSFCTAKKVANEEREKQLNAICDYLQSQLHFAQELPPRKWAWSCKLQSHHKSYLYPSYKRGTVTLKRSEPGDSNFYWFLERDEHWHFTIRDMNGNYLGFTKTGLLYLGTYDAFYTNWSGYFHANGFTLRNGFGKFLCAENTGSVRANRGVVGAWEKWTAFSPNNNEVNFTEIRPRLQFPLDAPQTQIRNVLCIDGGGMKGIVALTVLRHLEARLNQVTGVPKKLHERFDLICGTSTGGIIAFAMGVLELDLDTIQRMYGEMGESVFGGNFFTKYKKLFSHGHKYDQRALEAILLHHIHAAYGKDPALGELHNRVPRVFCVGTTTNQDVQPYLFRTYPSNRRTTYMPVQGAGENIIISKALKATSAAPTYFKAVDVGDGLMIQDGGLKANNPSEVALAELQSVFNISLADLTSFVSVGTGKIAAPNSKPGLFSTNFSQVLTELVGYLARNATDSHQIHERVEGQFNNSGFSEKYFRFNPSITSVELDSYSKEDLNFMRTSTDKYLTGIKRQKRVEQLCNLLKPKAEPQNGGN